MNVSLGRDVLIAGCVEFLFIMESWGSESLAGSSRMLVTRSIAFTFRVK